LTPRNLSKFYRARYHHELPYIKQTVHYFVKKMHCFVKKTLDKLGKIRRSESFADEALYDEKIKMHLNSGGPLSQTPMRNSEKSRSPMFSRQ